MIIDIKTVVVVGDSGPSEFGNNVSSRIGHRLAESGGVLVSGLFEPPFGSQYAIATNHDRGLAALSQAVIIVESATMDTACWAMDLGMEIGCMEYMPETQATEGAKMAGKDNLVSEGKATRLVNKNDMDNSLVNCLESDMSINDLTSTYKTPKRGREMVDVVNFGNAKSASQPHNRNNT